MEYFSSMVWVGLGYENWTHGHVCTRKFDRGLKAILHDKLHWLDVPERLEYKLCSVMVYRCLHGQASCYLADHL